MIYFISRILFWILLKIYGKLEVVGRENLPANGPFILASNHVSFADPAVLGVASSRVRLVFMAKKELFDIPVFHLWFKAMSCISVERGRNALRSLKYGVNILKKGKALVIFPEGTRSPDGSLQKAEPGIGFLARKADVPIIPAYLSGTDKVLPKGENRPKFAKVKAIIGKAVDVSESIKINEKRKVYESIGNQVMDAIAILKNA